MIKFGIYNIIKRDYGKPNNIQKKIKLEKYKFIALYITKSDINNILFFRIKSDNNPETCYIILGKASFLTKQDIIYRLFIEDVQHLRVNKAKKLDVKVIINIYITNTRHIINYLPDTIGKNNNT